MAPVLRVVTRGSALAFTQTSHLAAMLQERNPGLTFEIITLATTGDRITDRPLSQFRGKGVFVNELEKALLAGDADLAVHSLKDVPVQRVDGLILAAFPLRQNPLDCLITKKRVRLNELPHAAIIGVGSLRRLMQLKAVRPDLIFRDLRGNLDTRLRKLEEGQYDGIVAAAAGMLRLNWHFEENALLPMDLCLPAAGQGCLAIECKETDSEAQRIAATIDDASTRLEICAERDFLAIIGGGCHMPVAVYAKIDNDRLTMRGVIGDLDSGRLVRETVMVAREENHAAGKALAEKMLILCDKNEIRFQL